MFEIDLEQVKDLEDFAFECYLEGLSDAGWQGDPRYARLGYAAASLRYRFADLWRAQAIILDESLLSVFEKLFGLTAEQFFDRYAQVGTLVDSLVDEARELIDELNL
jgi:hypothetical protein